VHEQEVIIEKPDGSRVTVSVHVDPIRDDNGTIIGVVNFFNDITERKRAEDAQQRLVCAQLNTMHGSLHCYGINLPQ